MDDIFIARYLHGILAGQKGPNSMPLLKPYRWCPSETERDQEITDRITWARTKAMQRIRSIDTYRN